MDVFAVVSSIWDPWICNVRGDCVISRYGLEERIREFNLKRPGPNCPWQWCSHSRSDEFLTRRQKVWQDCPIAQALLALLAACYTKKSESMVTESPW